MNARRRRLWDRARALDTARDPALTPRARRLAQRATAPLDFDDLLEAPDWVLLEPALREQLAVTVGAVAVGGAWRRSVDGALLRRAEAAVGEAVLDAVLALPETPGVDDAEAAGGDREALAHLGKAALLGELTDRPALAARLSRQLGAQPWPAAAPAAATARGLLAQIGDA